MSCLEQYQERMHKLSYHGYNSHNISVSSTQCYIGDNWLQGEKL